MNEEQFKRTAALLANFKPRAEITLEEIHDYNNVLNITIYAKYIDHYFESDFDLEIYENVPLTKTNYWEDFKDKLDFDSTLNYYGFEVDKRNNDLYFWGIKATKN